MFHDTSTPSVARCGKPRESKAWYAELSTFWQRLPRSRRPGTAVMRWRHGLCVVDVAAPAASWLPVPPPCTHTPPKHTATSWRCTCGGENAAVAHVSESYTPGKGSVTTLLLASAFRAVLKHARRPATPHQQVLARIRAWQRQRQLAACNEEQRAALCSLMTSVRPRRWHHALAPRVPVKTIGFLKFCSIRLSALAVNAMVSVPAGCMCVG